MKKVYSKKLGILIFISTLFLITLSCNFTGSEIEEDTDKSLNIEVTPALPEVVQSDSSQDIVQSTEIASFESGVIWESSIDPGVEHPYMGFKVRTGVMENYYIFKRYNPKTDDINSYIIEDQFVFLSDGDKNLSKRNLNTGEVVWTSPVKGSFYGKGTNTIFVLGKDNRLFGIDVQTGAEKWKIILNSMVPSGQLEPVTQIISQGDNHILPYRWDAFGGENYHFLNIDEDTGEAFASEELEYEMRLIMDGVLFIGNIKETWAWKSIDISNGSETWKWDDEHYTWLYELDPDNRVFYFLANGDLYARDPVSGSDPWGAGLIEKNSINISVDLFMVMTDDKIVATIPTWDGPLEYYVFDRISGNLINIIQQQPYSGRSIKSDNNVLVIFNHDLKTSRGIDMNSGAVLWDKDEWDFDSIEKDDYLSIGNNLIFYNNSIIYSLDTLTGDILWTNADLGVIDTDHLFFKSSRMYNNKIIFVEREESGGNRRIISLDPNSGEIISYSSYIFNDPAVLQPITEDLWLVEDRPGRSDEPGKLILVKMMQ